MDFSSQFNAIVLIVVGIAVLFVGYSRHPPKTIRRRLLKRIIFFLLGYAFTSIIVLQANYFSKDDGRDWNLLNGLVPLAGAFLFALVPLLGVFSIGIHVFLTIAVQITPIDYPDWASSVFPKSLFVQSVGFLGGIVTLALQINTYYLLVSYLMGAAGISFILNGSNCFSGVVPAIRAFDFKADSYVCNPSATSTSDKIIFYSLMFAAPILGLVVQQIIAVLCFKVFFPKVVKKPAPTYEKQARQYKPQHPSDKPSLWHFIRHRGEYLAFRTHLKHLEKRLADLSLKLRQLASVGPYADDSQYTVISDQLEQVGISFTPAQVQERAIDWLEIPANWQLLANQPNDLFEMKHLNQHEYCMMMRKDYWGDFITLQASIQVHQMSIHLISSIWDHHSIHFPLLRQHIPKVVQQKQQASIKFGVKMISEKDVNSFQEGMVILVGSDNKSVRCPKVVALKSSTISSFVQESLDQGTNVVRFDEDRSLTGEVLFRICKKLEALHVMENSRIEDMPNESLKYLNLQEIFTEEKQKEKGTMTVSHYWGYHYGSLENARRKAESELPAMYSQMRIWSRPHTRIALTRVCHIGIFLSGLWWLVWMAAFGYRFESFITGLQFVIFWLAEFINFILSLIYNMNFWNPIRRKWKSLDKLAPPFLRNILVNCMIFHYSEDPKDTARTLGGSLRMKTTPGTSLKIWICDDGFWKYPPKLAIKKENPIEKVFNIIKRFFTKLTVRNAEGPACDIVEGNDMFGKPTASSSYLPCWPGEDEMIEFVKNHYGCVPKESVQDMLGMIAQELYRYYSEKLHSKVNITCKIEVATIPNGQIVRSDCAKASVRYHFYAETDGRIEGPEVILVGRVKPDVHHYKAGNINNAIYNNRMEGEFAILLDNDMKPTVDFITRTVPWFYYFDDDTNTYRINKAMSFVQSPQFFKDSTIAENHDFLGGKNSVFFQGIQTGRDGFDLCAFAGTNAIFSLPAMRTVNGLPYGSLTEDANFAIHLHRFGFRSIYVEDRLCVGLAPVTVANSMQQRSRWVKGSVQILMCNISVGPQDDHIIWETESPFEMYTKEDIEPFMVPFKHRKSQNIFRIAYALDTMLYPFSAMTAIFYMIIGFLFLISSEAPLNFTREPFTYRTFLVTFLPYFILKFAATFLSYNRVNPEDVWVAQEVWFGYSFASLFGIIDAFKESITGTSLGGWGVTGEGKRSSKLEWFNTVVFFILSLTIFIRFLVFLANPSQNITIIAAIFFSITIVIQMWPMVSTSLYEWVNNSNRPVDEKVDLHRYEIPNYIIFTSVLVLGILISVFTVGTLAGQIQ